MSFEHVIYGLLHLAAFAFFTSLALSGFMIKAGLLDTPVMRSNHKAPIPTAGGVGLVAGLGSGLLALSLYYPDTGGHNILAQIGALALAVALLGLFDDVRSLRPKLKFFWLLVLSCLAVYICGAPSTLPLAMIAVPIPIWLGICGAILWVFVVTNAVNFMDGINGLMGLVMTVAFAGLCAVSIQVGALTSAVLSILMVAGLLGFLPYNARPNARIFCGDIGALFTGFVFAVCTLLLIAEQPQSGLLYVGPLLILPFLTDVLLTMLLRAKRSEPLLAPHKTHIYQRLVQAGHSHISASLLYVLASMFMALIVWSSVYFGLILSIFFFMLWVCAMSMIYLVIHQNLQASERGQQQMPPNQ